MQRLDPIWDFRLTVLAPDSPLSFRDIAFFFVFFCLAMYRIHTYTLRRLQQRACDASFQLHGAPSRDCGLSGECVVKEQASAITCIVLMFRKEHGPVLASLHFKSQPNTHTRVIRLLWGKMTALFALICKSIYYISAFNVPRLTMHIFSPAGENTALRMQISRLVGSNNAGVVASRKQHGPHLNTFVNPYYLIVPHLSIQKLRFDIPFLTRALFFK